MLSCSPGWAAVARMRRALLLLALGATCAALMLYWRQQSDDDARRPEHGYARSIVAEPMWTWTCRKTRCVKSLSRGAMPQSLATCQMLCGDMPLWPYPTGAISLSATAQPMSLNQFTLKIVVSTSQQVKEHIEGAFDLLKYDLLLLLKTPPNAPEYDIMPVLVRVAVNESADPRLLLKTDESYELTLDKREGKLIADVTARSFCGARNAFETLSQMIWYDPYSLGGNLLILQAASVIDKPKFPYRSFMLDTARNYFPVKDILRTLDAMAANKLNTFHWHVTDSQSFPLRLASTAKLADHGAYSSEEMYLVEDVKVIVRHARLRGIRVVIEIDAPGHVGKAWSWGPSSGFGDLAYCIEASPWIKYCGEPPCGQLNPRNPNVYDILEDIYREIIYLTGVDDVFHLGGDEVSETCWHENINGTHPMELWLDFTVKALNRLVRANRGVTPALTLVWSSKMTSAGTLERLPSTIGVQVWGGSDWPDSSHVLASGRRSVLSHVDAWYLDCGFGSWRDHGEGNCNPYRSWQQVYEHQPWDRLDPSTVSLIQGGAACMWTEQLGPEGLDARVWPRTAAVAERLWTDGPAVADPVLHVRMDLQRTRLVNRGVGAAAIWPAWCSQNPYKCTELS